MVPASFHESNAALARPSDMTEEECGPLCVFRGATESGLPVVVSCWKLTQAELDEITRTGRVWLTVYGVTMPPVALATSRPFV